MAERIFNFLSAENKLPYHAISAGISAIDGDKISLNSKTALDDLWCIKSDDHSSQKVTPSLLSQSDLILTMTVSHKKALISYQNSIANKIYTLKEFNNSEGFDIQDPFCMPIEIYKDTALELYLEISKLINNLLHQK